MPELPEVETIRRGLLPCLQDAMIHDTFVRQTKLRWPIADNLASCLNQQKIVALSRRGKYLLIGLSKGTLIVHLGMSGSLRLVDPILPAERHDHVDILISSNKVLRYRDPRRFGAMLWTEAHPFLHPLLHTIGIEPLDVDFTGDYLWQRAQKRSIQIKSFIMNSKIVAGIGNIYAAEALFYAKIHPATPANQLTQAHYEQLVKSIKQVLTGAIEAGGTSLKDFVDSQGQPGYFAQKLAVYGRAKQPCIDCGNLLQSMRLGQRSTVFCKSCQLLFLSS